MAVELKIPEVGESVREVQIAKWLKSEGDTVRQDEDLVELETDKATVQLPCPAAGVLSKITKGEGEIVEVGQVIGYVEEGDGQAKEESTKETKEQATSGNGKKKRERKQEESQEIAKGGESKEAKEEATAAEEPEQVSTSAEEPSGNDEQPPEKEQQESSWVVPSARRALSKYGLRAEQITPTGSHGRLLEQDVLRYVSQHGEGREASEKQTAQADARHEEPRQVPEADSGLEEVVPMSMLRRTIARRLVEAQQQAALLTTFNEIDMTAVQNLRRQYVEVFQKKYGIKLGFMSFFAKATIDALKQFPQLNAEIRGNNIAYRDYYHLGVAIGGEKGLVVPVLRHAERMSFAEIEQTIADFAGRVQENKIAPQELQGGTFTISNGGIFGSLLSTPIVNPPQSGVLGMHAIQERPVAREGQVVIRPMMYVALTYDHRLVDGREAVTFLRRIKEAVEDPSRMLIEV